MGVKGKYIFVLGGRREEGKEEEREGEGARAYHHLLCFFQGLL